jgi:hypothetical protein
MSILKIFIRLIKSLFKKEYGVIYIAPCGTVVNKLVDTIDIEEGKEVAKFNHITGKLYWPSDGSKADGPGIRDIPNYKNKDKVK